MTWEKARVKMTCGSCGLTRPPIEVGEPVLFVTEARKARCVACAKRTFNTEPPASWPVPVAASRAQEPPPFVPLMQALPADFDAKMAAAGRDR